MMKLLNKTRRADITFCRNGRIMMTARIAGMLNLTSAHAINIASDNGEYYLFATDASVGRHIGRCYPTKRRSHNFCANSVAIARYILDSAGVEGPQASFMAGDAIVRDGRAYVPIIIKRPL